MSIQNEIDRIRENIAAAYGAVEELGGEIPASDMRNSANLAEAILTIPVPPKIYGAAWTGGSTVKLTRTDDASQFPDPVPAVDSGSGSSPFDHIYPWSGMTKVTDELSNGQENVLVAIPKYWVKVSHNPFQVQIAGKAVDGFQVSPAHRDRGDGAGERDVVYIGRYECDSSYMSRSGQTPLGNKNLAAFRSGIKNLGTGYWQRDFAMQLTLWYLYIVEFANWDSQAVIGQGNSALDDVIDTGGTDSMTYHTGRAAGTDGQTAIQYRNIENLWGNLSELCDGIIAAETNICTYNNPSQFTSAYGGTNAVIRSNKAPSDAGYVTALGYDAADPTFIFPSAVGGSGATYIPDLCDAYFANTKAKAVNVGGHYHASFSAAEDPGIFSTAVNTNATTTYAWFGSRLQKLPAA